MAMNVVQKFQNDLGTEWEKKPIFNDARKYTIEFHKNHLELTGCKNEYF